MTISHAFVINLPQSTERYKLFCEEAKHTSIPIERLDGIDGKPYVKPGDPRLTAGIIGCMKASIRAIEIAREQGYKNVLIFDDDAQLCDNFDTELQAALNELPEDWVMLRLHPTTTGNPVKNSQSQNLYRVLSGNGTYGYVLNSKYYDVILNYLSENYRLPSTKDPGHIKTYDVIIQELMTSLPFFETKKRLVYHRDGFSDRMGINMSFGLGKPKEAKVYNNKIKIYYPLHVKFHAEKLCEVLNANGHESELTTEVDPLDEALHILYCAFQLVPEHEKNPNADIKKYFPKKYITYQCEQWNSHWFTKRYWHIMHRSIAIWEWSKDNVRKYPNDLKERVSHVPCGLITPPNMNGKDIDILFYGTYKKYPHRIKYLRELKRWFKIEIVDELYGDEILKKISRSKVILNIHCYDRCTLEMFRVNESLCCGANVVSERVATGYYPEQYTGLVTFGSNIGALKTALENSLRHNETKDLSKLDNTEFILEAISKVQSSHRRA